VIPWPLAPQPDESKGPGTTPGPACTKCHGHGVEFDAEGAIVAVSWEAA
jgi:hypothetical protein